MADPRRRRLPRPGRRDRPHDRAGDGSRSRSDPGSATCLLREHGRHGTPHFAVEGTRHHANLFAVLVGSTARGRKGTSARDGSSRSSGPLTSMGPEQHQDGSRQRRGVCLARPGPDLQDEKRLRRTRVTDRRHTTRSSPTLASTTSGSWSSSRSSQRSCGSAGGRQNTLSPTLRSAWDSGILRTLAKNSPATATDAHISIIGHITREELRRALAEVEGFNGFANRFLWLAVRRSKLLPDGGQDLDLTLLAQRLALAAEQARSVERMQRDQAAAALWRQSMPNSPTIKPAGSWEPSRAGRRLRSSGSA